MWLHLQTRRLWSHPTTASGHWGFSGQIRNDRLQRASPPFPPIAFCLHHSHLPTSKDSENLSRPRDGPNFLTAHQGATYKVYYTLFILHHSPVSPVLQIRKQKPRELEKLHLDS